MSTALAEKTPTIQQSMARQLVIGGDATQRELTGDEKAAVLLLSLGPDFGRPILEELDEMEVKALSRTMVRMGAITQEMLDSLFAEFVTHISANGTVAGNSDTTQRLLLSFLPPNRVDAIMEEIRGPAGRNMWEKLSNVQEDILASYLKNEYPQTIAVVLSKIATAHASRVLGILPEELAIEVIKALMFTFVELGRLDSSALQALLSKVDKKELALALKGANDTIKELFFANMSARSGKLLRDDMDAMGPVRLKDVDEAQGRLVSTAKDMAARG